MFRKKILLKCIPNTFSGDDEKIDKLEKEIKELKSQINDFKKMIADVQKIKVETTTCKKDLENFLSKIKQNIYQPDK